MHACKKTTATVHGHEDSVHSPFSTMASGCRMPVAHYSVLRNSQSCAKIQKTNVSEQNLIYFHLVAIYCSMQPQIEAGGLGDYGLHDI